LSISAPFDSFHVEGPIPRKYFHKSKLLIKSIASRFIVRFHEGTLKFVGFTTYHLSRLMSQKDDYSQEAIKRGNKFILNTDLFFPPKF